MTETKPRINRGNRGQLLTDVDGNRGRQPCGQDLEEI